VTTKTIEFGRSFSMIAVTVEELEQAEADAERAGRDLKEVTRSYAAHRSSPGAYEQHQEAIERADHATVRAQALRAEWDEQQAVRDQRAAEGEAAVREMAGVVDGLVASRAAAVDAVVEARAAMARALDALAAHDGLVRAAAADLGKRGLRDGEDLPTGARMDESVSIGGTKWPLVDGGSVVGQVLVDLVAVHCPRHPLARMVWRPYGGVTAGRGRDEVLALVRAEKGR
jgi:hypothetical protein